MRIRPIAPPLLFWKVSASTTCSRVTLPILVSTRPIGRPWSWSMGGMPPAGVGETPPVVGGRVPEGGRTPPAAAALPPPTPTGFAPPGGTVTLVVGRRLLPGFIGVTGFLAGSGDAGLGVCVSVRDMCVLVYGGET